MREDMNVQPDTELTELVCCTCVHCMAYNDNVPISVSLRHAFSLDS